MSLHVDNEDPDSISALEMDPISPGIWRWECYSPHHKVDLSSHAVGIGSRLYIFDPIRLPSSQLKELIKDFREPIIVLTNGNHERAAVWWSREANAPIFRPEGEPCTAVRPTLLPTGKTAWLDWQLHPLPGGAPGETAFQHGNLMVFGDAVVNLPGRPCILPPKYCQNHPALVEQLLALSELEFGAALMSHGTPWTTNASAQLRSLCSQVVG